MADSQAALHPRPQRRVLDSGGRAILPSRTPYGVDIDQEMPDCATDRARKVGLSSVGDVLGRYVDRKLPVNDVDVIFLHRTLYMIEHRQTSLNAARWLVVCQRPHGPYGRSAASARTLMSETLPTP